MDKHNSDRASSLHRKTNKHKYKIKVNPDLSYRQIPQLRGVSAGELSNFFDNCKDFFSVLCFSCALIPLCVVIPYLRKAFSPWVYVFPGVPESVMAVANQLSAALESHSHLTVSQHFFFFLPSTPSPSPTTHCHCINCGYKRRSDLL